MRYLRIASATAVAVGLLAAATACQVPNQHTLVGMSSFANGRGGYQAVNFVFDQGLPTTATARYVATPPAGPSGKPVGVDGQLFVRVSFNPAVAHDARGATTAPDAYYPTRASNPIFTPASSIAEVARFEDFEGYVGYAIGIKPGWGTDRHLAVVRSGDTITVRLYFYGGP